MPFFNIFLTLLLACTTIFAQEQGKFKEQNGQNEYKIGVLYWSINIKGQVAMKDGLTQMAKKINDLTSKTGGKKVKLIEKIAGDGEEGMERQVSQFLEILNEKVDAIVVQPTDNAVLIEALKKANDLNIPVIAYDQYISRGKLHSFITSDNYQAGFLDGEFMAQEFRAKKEVKIALVEYPYVSSTISRVDGFMDALEAYKLNYKIIKHYEAVEPKKGKMVGKQILKDFPIKNSLDMVFCVNDGGCIALVHELLEAGRDDILIATVDGDPIMIEMMKKNKNIKIDSAQFCGQMGAVALQKAYDVLESKEVAKEILLPVFPVTSNTMHMFLGWDAQMPENFKKPWNSQTPVWSNNLTEK